MIYASAMLHEGKIYTGKRHGDCIKKAVKDTGIMPVKGDGGFMANICIGGDGDRYNVFMSREEAARYAVQIRQIVKTKIKDRLFSEDLW